MTAEREIPVLRRDQLGVGVRGKYFERFALGSNVVVLEPEIHEAFPTSEAVNKASPACSPSRLRRRA